MDHTTPLPLQSRPVAADNYGIMGVEMNKISPEFRLEGLPRLLSAGPPSVATLTLCPDTVQERFPEVVDHE